jgi:di/tricarboxylate transporter
MTYDVWLSLAVLVATITLLATGRVRTDVVALLALVAVSVLGLTTPERALAGFASPAVLTIAGMFVLSAGLSRTGVAEMLGRWVLRLAGPGEVRVVVAVTVVSGLLSGFMTNVGVAAMMLPVVVGIARKSDLPPSKLLIPMALGAQLGGFITLVGTTPNLIAADALSQAGLEPFGLFSFTPIGLVLLAAGTVLIAAFGPRLLPTRTPRDSRGGVDRSGIQQDVHLSEELFFLVVPSQSLLEGKTLAESLIDSALGVHVLAIIREGRTIRSPGPEATLKSGDRILVQGRPDFFLELRGRRHLTSRDESVSPEWLESEEVGLAMARVASGSRFVGRSAAELDFRSREGLLVLALRRGDHFRRRTHFVDTPMQAGDELLLQGPRDRIETFAQGRDFEGVRKLDTHQALAEFDLADRLWALQITKDSLLAGRRLDDTRLGDAMGMMVVAVGQGDAPNREIRLLPGGDLILKGGDHLLMKARPEDMIVLRGLQRLEVELEVPVDSSLLEGADAGFTEAVIAPRSSLVGKTLRQANFRSRFGMHVVGIVREGEVLRRALRDEVLKFGDALLLYGPRRQQRALAQQPDLILLRGPDEDGPEVRLAPLSLLIVAAALVPVMMGWLPLAVGVLSGAALMVITRCLSPDEAYASVDWPTLVLVAGMLALGAGMGDAGTVTLLGEGLLQATGGYGAHLLLVVLVLVSAIAGQVIPATAVVVLLAPVGIAGAEQLGVSPYPLVMAVAIAATSLASPVAHPAHALVMAPAGYRIGDYLRLGIPMTLLVLTLTVLVTPLFLPF